MDLDLKAPSMLFKALYQTVNDEYRFILLKISKDLETQLIRYFHKHRLGATFLF